jgi:predicted phage terminase large subunit-like protein
VSLDTEPATPAGLGSWRDLPPAAKLELLARLAAKRREKVLERWPTAGSFAAYIDPTTKNPPHLQLIDEKLRAVLDGRCERLIVTIAPQEGKSERISHYGAEWMLIADPSLRVAIASYEQETARRWGQKIRDDLRAFRLPIQLKDDSQAAGRWNLQGHGGSVYTVGVGGALTGRPVDVLLIDDPVKDREQADSETYRQRVWDWWTDVARTRLAPGGRTIVVMTRWHEDDFVGRLLKSPGAGEWDVLHIPAQCEDPATDPLGRAAGEYLPSARQWPEGRWEQVKRDVGSRTWNALYQGKPAPTEGDVWLRQWWQWFDAPFWDVDGVVHRVPAGYEVVQSWDMAFKDTRASDYVVGQVWAKRGNEAFLLDQVRERLGFPATVKAVQAMSVKWPQTTAKYVEDKANGTAVIASLRSSLSGLIAVEPAGGKMARASAVAPLIEAGQVWLPRFLPGAHELVDEAAAFPNGTHDDAVDAASQALNKLFLQRRARILV